MTPFIASLATPQRGHREHPSANVRPTTPTNEFPVQSKAIVHVYEPLLTIVLDDLRPFIEYLNSGTVQIAINIPAAVTCVSELNLSLTLQGSHTLPMTGIAPRIPPLQFEQVPPAPSQQNTEAAGGSNRRPTPPLSPTPSHAPPAQHANFAGP